MENINKLRKFYQLKNVERVGPVGNRKESPAEHSWSALILADFFLSTMEEELDRLRVYELLMYHDVVEIEAGDEFIFNNEEKFYNKKEKEKAAAHILKDHLPKELGSKFLNLFHEYEDKTSKEAEFAKAIDALDAMIHFLDYKEAWKGWTIDKVRKLYGSKIKSSKLTEIMETILTYCEQEGYFAQH